MKIEFNSIGEYLEFVESIKNSNEPVKADTGCLSDYQIGNIEKRFVDTEKTIGTLQEQILKLLNQVKKLQEKQKPVQKKNKPKNNVKPTIIERPKYARSYQVKLNIKDIKNDGTIIMKGNKKAKYTMFDLLKIKRMLQQNKALNEIAKCFENIGEITVYRICWNIEEGYLNGWFYEWNRIPKKEVEVVNNPEKRKELLGFA